MGLTLKSKYQVQVVGAVLIAGVALALAGTSYFWGLPLIEKSKSSVHIKQAQQFMNNLLKNIEEVGREGGTKVMDVDLKGVLTIDPKKDVIDYTLKVGYPSYASTLFVPLNDNLPYKKKMYVGDKAEKVTIPECSATTLGCYAEYIDGADKLKMSGSCVNNLNGKTFGNEEVIDCVNNGEGDEFIVHLEGVKTAGFWFLEGKNETKIYGIEGVNKPLVLLAKTLPSPGQKEFIDIYRIYSREVDDPNTEDGRYYDIEVTNRPQVGPGHVKIYIRRGEGELIPGGSKLGGDLSKIKIRITFH